MQLTEIHKRISEIVSSLPEHVVLEAAAKTRNAEQARAAVQAGIKILGYNYVQEAEKIKDQLSDISVRWHMIGHLQKNKINKAVHIFDLIETVDSIELAELLDKACKRIGKTMPILIEVNSGRENRKTGVEPEQVEPLVRKICKLPNVKIQGLMTMGPQVDDPEELRPFFAETRKLYDRLYELHIPDTQFQFLSMGMSDSYKVAVQEGATIIRLGSILFGPRIKK